MPFSPLQILKAKGSDSFAPLGPWVVPGLLYDDLRLTTRLNGQVVQSVPHIADDQEGGGDRR
jgi:2-keto-4-pentenoate hydratase/2-oxohepta-3-ene-1,7-dioic acid hydratase in catechol pathway